MGLMDSGLASIFGAAFGALFLDGLVHRDGTDPVYDAEGNITGYSGGADVPCKVQRDTASYSMVQSDGYVTGDVALIVLADGLGIEIGTDHQITDGQGVRWMVKSAELDAVSSHWICRGRKA